ncbi:hypothetical protein [Bradyrhizobium mercantei]|uniref:hypothetical protein n=1 Tax=Bradyrhizobium mercantei TaxID=1904807 RepID=UPI00117823CD|nr:hypothetical protein [Bradyrhizobium mercantei]
MVLEPAPGSSFGTSTLNSGEEENPIAFTAQYSAEQSMPASRRQFGEYLERIQRFKPILTEIEGP